MAVHMLPVIHTGTPEGDLAAAIISQALADYRAGQKMVLKGSSDSLSGEKLMKECEDFFHSTWFRKLSGLLPGNAMDELTREAVYSARILMKRFLGFRYEAMDPVEPDLDLDLIQGAT